MRGKLFFTLILGLFLGLFCGLTSVFAQTETRIISAGILNSRAIDLPEPPYPAAARAVQASGAVNVQILIDELGTVVAATAVSGHPLLRAASVQAARQARFQPTYLEGRAVRVTGVVVFYFVLPMHWRSIGTVLGDAEIEIAETDALVAAADDLRGIFPDLAKSLATISENYKSDEIQFRFQSNAVGEVIDLLLSRLAERPKALWYFEFGLTIGRIRANYFDETVLRNSLSKFRELAASAPVASDFAFDTDDIVTLQKLAEMNDRLNFTRKDKLAIKKLVDQL